MSENLIANYFQDQWLGLLGMVLTLAFKPSSHIATQSFLDCSEAQGLVISELFF